MAYFCYVQVKFYIGFLFVVDQHEFQQESYLKIVMISWGKNVIKNKHYLLTGDQENQCGHSVKYTYRLRDDVGGFSE